MSNKNKNDGLKVERVYTSDAIKDLLQDCEGKAKRIAELEGQIEKMKCCDNCKHSEEDNKSSTICDECFELCYWEMKE